jgi:hypothetical protein
MPFKAPVRPKLTESQSKALAKINSIRQYANSAGSLSFDKFNKYRSLISLNKNTNLPPEQQISTFDLCLSIIDAVKPGTSDAVTQQFLSKVFAVTGPDSTVLEEMIIKALANALDKNGKQLAPKPPSDSENQEMEGEENVDTQNESNTDSEQQESLSQTESFQQFEWLEYKVILKNQEGDNYLIEIINNSNGKVPFFEILETNASQNPNFNSNANSSTFEQIKNFYLRKLNPGTSNNLNEPFIYNSITYPFSGTKISEINSAKGILKGVVFATDNNETIPGATVEVLNSNPPIKLITDINGEFKIENINFGIKTLKVSYDFASFKEKEVEINVIAETTTEIQIPLEFQGVVVNAEGDIGVEGGENDSLTVKYTYETIRPIIEYDFDLNTDEVNKIVKINVTTNKQQEFPNFEILVDNLIDTSDDDFDETITSDNDVNIEDLIFDAEEIIESILLNGYVFTNSDGSSLQYPPENTSGVEIIIKNNINLPEYNKLIPIINANQNFVDSFFNEEVSKDREVNEVFYPAEGTVGLIFEGQFQAIENNNTSQNETLPEGSVNVSENNFTSAPTEAPEPTPFSFFGFREEDIGLTNQQYLTKYLLPVLTLGKRALVAKIITMIFGPKEKMDNNAELQNILLNSAACGEQMFSVYNNPSITEAELEYNKIKLREQLEKGKIELTISCQKIEISLPENYLQEFDLEDSEIIGIPEEDRSNPAASFVLLQNFVENELQKQRSDEDASAVRRSFLQIIIDKIIQYVGIAFATNPQMSQVMGFINFELSKSGQSPLSAKDLCSSPCEIVNACQSNNKEEFEKKSAFNDILLNSLLGLVLSLLIPRIINECKLIIQGYLTEKIKEKIAILRLRQQRRFEQFNAITGTLDKAAQYKSAFENSGIQEILNYIDSQNTRTA